MHEASPGDASSGNDSLLAEQRRRNEASRDAWQRFAPHRARVTQLLLDAARGKDSPRLLLLGAGNCNDVDLTSLAEVYRQIDLVDWDTEALKAGQARQGLADHPAIVLHGNVDLLAEPASPGCWFHEDANAEVVASVCLLSQLIEQAMRRSPSDDADLALPLVQAVRQRHLAQMTQWLSVGGEAVLVTDFVSSDTLPEVSSVGETELPSLLARALAERNFFTGLHPGMLLQVLRSDPAIAAQVTGLVPQAPWRWDFGPRIYAVFALGWRKLQDAARNL